MKQLHFHNSWKKRSSPQVTLKMLEVEVKIKREHPPLKTGKVVKEIKVRKCHEALVNLQGLTLTIKLE